MKKLIESINICSLMTMIYIYIYNTLFCCITHFVWVQLNSISHFYACHHSSSHLWHTTCSSLCCSSVSWYCVSVGYFIARCFFFSFQFFSVVRCWVPFHNFFLLFAYARCLWLFTQEYVLFFGFHIVQGKLHVSTDRPAFSHSLETTFLGFPTVLVPTVTQSSIVRSTLASNHGSAFKRTTILLKANSNFQFFETSSQLAEYVVLLNTNFGWCGRCVVQTMFSTIQTLGRQIL